MIRFWKSITIEPTMILYMLAFRLTSVVEQEFYLSRACSVDCGFGSDICRNLSLPGHEHETQQVKSTIASFFLWNGIASQAFCVFLSFFIGAWSDRRGRKLPLIFGLFGKLYFVLILVLVAYKKTWSVMSVIYLGSIPMTLTGSDIAIFASCFAYISDITSEVNRTLRITVLNICYLATSPIGIFLGSVLFEHVFNRSFLLMFATNATLLFLSIVYSLVKLKWLTTDDQESILNCKTNYFVDFFNWAHFRDTIKIVTKQRKDNLRKYIFLLLLITFLYTFQRAEKNITFVYLKTRFAWTFDDISLMRTVQSILQIVVMTIGIPLLSVTLKLTDPNIIFIAALFHCAAKLAQIMARTKLHFYIGVLLQSPGPLILPLIRSMVSKLVEIDERGKIFALLSVMDNVTGLFSNPVYATVFKWSPKQHLESFYWVTVLTEATIAVLVQNVS